MRDELAELILEVPFKMQHDAALASGCPRGFDVASLNLRIMLQS